ncbi:MAG TPA: PAS domain-containing protein [Rhodocyclaceae bacterium]|nr:PAS domain-containing protein [Rhodocyclaceae bacterium]HNB79084.1 PAS domain-containing protein [Rhodocyclaceae bacterium]HNC62498.1 PAS domain-containing protein [Rhodocyclaceae bacterium]HNH11670.1 PAS domain-containing protein [Rhodocyclaceae bacterium]
MKIGIIPRRARGAGLRTSDRTVMAIAVGYALLGALWILFSDRAVEAMFGDPASLMQASRYKGWFFIAFTAVLLYVMLMRLVRRNERLQQERYRSLELLNAVADSSEDAIFAKDVDGRYILFNRAASEFVGRPVEDVLGKDDRHLFPPEQAEHLMAIGRRVLQAGNLETNEEVLETRQGRRVFLATKGPLRDAQGRVFGIFGTSRDITARKRVEDALHDREHQLRAIIGYSPSVLSLKRPDGRYAVANPNLQRIHHTTEADIVGKTDFDLYPEDVARAIAANDQLVLQTGARHSIEEILPVDGQMRTFMSHMFPVADNAGRIAYICRISLDITDAKRDRDMLARTAEDLAATLQAIPDLMFELDQNGRYLSVRTSQENLLALPAGQCVGRNVHDVLPREAADAVMASLAQAARSGSDYGRAIAIPLEAGTRWFELSVARKAGKPGDPARFLVLSRDITDRKAALDALRRQADDMVCRNTELERFNRVMIGRELDMIELKRQINALSRELGREPPHPARHVDAAVRRATEKPA